MLCVYKHRDTSLYDDECECTQYNNESVYGEHDIRGSADLWSLLQTASLTRDDPRGVRASKPKSQYIKRSRDLVDILILS